MKRMRVYAALILLLTPVLALRAQEDPATQSGTAVLYEVEVIAFRHLDQRGNTPEVEGSAAGLATENTRVLDAGAEAATNDVNSASERAYPALAPPDRKSTRLNSSHRL